MRKIKPVRIISALLTFLIIFTLACQKQERKEDGIAAYVGEEAIMQEEILKIIGKTEREKIKNAPDSKEGIAIKKTALEKLINWNLLYIDGKNKSLDKDPLYRSDLEKFEIGLLSDMFIHKKVIEEANVSEKEIEEYFKEHEERFKNSKLDNSLKAKIRYMLILGNYEKLSREVIEKTKKRHKFEIYKDRIESLFKNDENKESSVIGKVDDYALTWGKFKSFLGRGLDRNNTQVYVKIIEDILERIMLSKEAKSLGMDKSKEYKKALHGFEKGKIALANRLSILKEISLTENELKEYYKVHKEEFNEKSAVHLRAIICKKEEEALKVKKLIDNDPRQFANLAIKYSIEKDVRENFGNFGFLTEREVREIFGARVAEVVFSAKEGSYIGPLKGENGYYVLNVLKRREEKILPFEQIRWKILRNLRDERFNAYIEKLKEKIKVKVFYLH